MTALETQHLVDGHRFLHADMARLRQLIDLPAISDEQIEEMNMDLCELHEHLAGHFEFLDQLGYLAEVNAWAPRLHARLDRLHWEQFVLVNDLTCLVSDLHQMQHSAVRLTIGRVANLLGRIEEHEHQKNELVVEALYQDPGAMD